MRSAAFLCACALLLVTGCATTRRTPHLTAELQWEALCRRMPQRRIPGAPGDTRRSSLTRTQESALQHIAVRALDSVVRVKTANPDWEEAGNDSSDARAALTNSGGTGIVISSDGLILTNEHVVRHAHDVTVVFHDGTEFPVKAIVVHPHQDIAVLQIDRNEMRSALPSLESVKSGTPVVAVSCTADRREGYYRTGVVTSGRRSLQRELDPSGRRDYGDLVETTVELEPGFSGGPLLDSEGRLVGLNVAVTGSPGTDRYRGYAIPFDHQMHEAIGELVASARAAPPEAP